LSTPEEDAFFSSFFEELLERGLVEWRLDEKPEEFAKELGAGGVGVVSEGLLVLFCTRGFICLGLCRGNLAAIKKLRTDRVRPHQGLGRFETEAKISSSLCAHSNVVTTFGIWIDEQLRDCMIAMGGPPSSAFLSILSLSCLMALQSTWK
jgi:hypothetical protein